MNSAETDKHIALLLAGGKGNRMHTGCPKQFATIGGKPVIAYTMRAFQRHPLIHSIYVVCHPEWANLVTQTAASEQITKFRRTIPAGDNSMLSLQNGVRSIRHDEPGNPVILTHEAVRPLVSAHIITDNLRTFHSFGNAITAIKSNEAYMLSHDDASSSRCIPREVLFRAQTPQTFCLNHLEIILKKAGDLKARPHQSLYTMTAALFPQTKLYISPGSELNFKLTLPIDMDVLEALLTSKTLQLY